MPELLGLDTRGNFKDGPLQDVHWPEGCSATSPATRWARCTPRSGFAAMRREMPDLDARIGRGDLSAVFDWLQAKVWSQGSLWETPELVRRASGETLNPAHLASLRSSRTAPAARRSESRRRSADSAPQA
jgi:carboxypeptidase Taq